MYFKTHIIMKWQTIFFTFIISLAISSCISIDGFNMGYKKLNDQEKKDIKFIPLDSAIDSYANSKKILSINGKQLKEHIRNNDTSIVYLWGPNCHSSSCIMLFAFENFCSERNYNLYILAEYYDIDQIKAQSSNLEFPVLIANHKYYNHRYANKVRKLFVDDLLGETKLSKDEKYFRYLIFKGNKLIKAQRKLF